MPRGRVVGQEMQLNAFRQIAHDSWTQVPERFANVSIAAFTVMPNHLHAIIVIGWLLTVMGDDETRDETSLLRRMRDADTVGVRLPKPPRMRAYGVQVNRSTTGENGIERDLARSLRAGPRSLPTLRDHLAVQIVTQNRQQAAHACDDRSYLAWLPSGVDAWSHIVQTKTSSPSRTKDPRIDTRSYPEQRL